MSNNMYAVEGYTKKDGTCRYDIGNLEQCEEVIKNLILSSLSLNTKDVPYFRIVEITDKDVKDWNYQLENFPKMEKTQLIYGDYIELDKTAKFLGVTPGRVSNLIREGLLSYKLLDGRKKISIEEVLDRKKQDIQPGRPHGKKTVYQTK